MHNCKIAASKARRRAVRFVPSIEGGIGRVGLFWRGTVILAGRVGVMVDVTFDDFVRSRSTSLLRVAYLLTGDRHAAEDLLQDVLARLYVLWRRVRGAPEAYARRAPLDNGAFVTRIGPQRGKFTLAVGRPPLGERDTVHFANFSEIVANRTRRDPQRVQMALPGVERSWGPDPLLASTRVSLFDEPAITPYLDPCGLHTSGVDPEYNVIGATPDGRRLWLVTLQWDDGPARHLLFLAGPGGPFALVGRAIAPSGSGDRPVLITVPDRQGTLVAMAGARLRHRLAGGDWLPGGTDAALIPPEAVDVELAAQGRVPEIIRVPGS